jgi:uncharacterized protein (TIRG00374 family)
VFSINEHPGARHAGYILPDLQRVLLSRTLLFLVKVAISVGLLVYLLRSVDLADVFRHFQAGDPRLFGIAVAIYAVVVVLSTVRWKVLLDALGGTSSFGALTQSYLVSAFFANFLPSNVGGDVVRVREAARAAGSHTASLTVAAMDRVVGFIALYFIAAPAFLLGGPMVQGLAGARVILAGLTVLFLAMGAVFMTPGLVTSIAERVGLRRFPWIHDRFVTVQVALDAFRANKGTVVYSFLLSLVLQFLGVSYFYIVARALGIPLDLPTSLLMVPLCTLIQAIPISFNGWGLREGMYVLYFRQVGLPRESALAFSIVASALVVLLSLSGLFVWLGRRSHAHESQTPPPS